MNIHHLELFYYVARHGGIVRAVRHMPYGIQQPAISSQILALEQDLGKKLFERTPFELTEVGTQLFAFVRPFFENIEATATKLRKESAPLLRVGAVELVLRDHLHSVIARLRTLHPRIRLALRSGYTPQLHAWLQDRQIDIAIAPLEGRPPAQVHSVALLRMPLVLLVPRRMKLESAAEIWAQGAVAEPLITLPAAETITRLFRKGLARRRVDWPTAIEASSLELVVRYVASGYGIGVNVNVPAFVKRREVRVLPLEGFDPIEIRIMWRGEITSEIRTVIEESTRYVKQHWPAWACADDVR
jgi:DNA-binding transcriptional LysR family regulator